MKYGFPKLGELAKFIRDCIGDDALLEIKAKERLRKNDSIIVMEGFMDVIRASTVGINNCIATMGTALTKQNANLLKRTASSIILCFDGDEAGEEATTKAIEIFKEIDVVPKVVRLEENLDPDEYILKYGEESLRQPSKEVHKVSQKIKKITH